MADLKRLTREEVETFKLTGLLFPKRMLTANEAAGHLGKLEAYEKIQVVRQTVSGGINCILFFLGSMNLCGVQKF